MMRVFGESDGVNRALPIRLPPAELKVLQDLVCVWPPTVDGYLFQNQHEVDVVIQLKESLKDIAHDCKWASLNIDDIRVLLCFARARKLHLKAAAQMFRTAYIWRKENEPEKWVPGYVLPVVVDKYGTGGPWGFDKDGSPVFIERIAMIDPAGVLKHCSVDELVEAELCRNEYLQALTDKCVVRDRKLHWGITIILDLTNLGTQHLNAQGLQAIKKILYQSDHYYPERAKRILIINAPFIFSAIWKIVQHFLDPVTREKVQIYGHNAKDVLLKYIDTDQLPVFLGGTATNGNGNPECNPPIRGGGKVPKDFEEPQFEDSFGE